MFAYSGTKVVAGRALATATIVLCAFAMAGCSSYVERSGLIKQALVSEDYEAALKNVEEISKSSSGLLYYYEKGLVLHYQDQYEASNEAFEEAEILHEELYTKSVTRELVALAVKDDFSKYRGDPFEAVLVNYYKILNYLHMGDSEGALVECRRVNRKLQMIIDAGEETYRNDPFVQYLTAMVYDAANDASDASVSYRVAAAAYDELGGDAPPSLYCDAAENARILGDVVAVQEYEGRVSGECAPRQAGTGIVNLFLESGFVTHKIEQSVIIPIYKDDNYDDKDSFAVTMSDRRHRARRSGVKVTHLLKFAIPALADDPIPFHSAVVRARPMATAAESGDGDDESGDAADMVEAHTVVVEDLGVLARRAFEAREAKILVRTIIRALAKCATQSKADDENRGLGVLMNIFNVATETADTRSWSTLPRHIMMSRLVLPAGTWELDVTLLGDAGQRVDNFTIKDVVVRNGRSKFLNFRVH